MLNVTLPLASVLPLPRVVSSLSTSTTSMPACATVPASSITTATTFLPFASSESVTVALPCASTLMIAPSIGLAVGVASSVIVNWYVLPSSPITVALPCASVSFILRLVLNIPSLPVSPATLSVSPIMVTLTPD